MGIRGSCTRRRRREAIRETGLPKPEPGDGIRWRFFQDSLQLSLRPVG